MPDTPSTWPTVLLGDLVEGVRGVSYQPHHLLTEASDSSVTLLRANNIQNGRLEYDELQFVPKSIVKDKQLMDIGDIAVCMSNGSKHLVGKSAQYRGEHASALTVGAFCSIFKARSDADPTFVQQLFLSNTYQSRIDFSLAGSAINNLKNSDIESIQFRVPTKPVQKKIGRILQTIDQAIEHTTALIEKYQQIKAGLMHDLFTRGIGADGKLRPPREQAPELYQQTPIGWIPKEWSLKRAGELCELITKGTTPSSHNMWEGGEGIRFLRVDNLSLNGILNFEASNFRISSATHHGALGRSRCLPGDVLTNIVGPPLGKIGRVTTDIGEVNINQAIAVFRPKHGLLQDLLARWLSTHTVARWFQQRSKQTSGQVNLTLTMCQYLPIPHIEHDEQRAISERLTSNDTLIQDESHKSEILQSLKSGLMHDLLTGKVEATPNTDVKEAADVQD